MLDPLDVSRRGIVVIKGASSNQPSLLDSRIDLAPDIRLVGLGHVVAFLLPASDRSARQAGFSTENMTSPSRSVDSIVHLVETAHLLDRVSSVRVMS